jgi:hypothetical protein
MASATPLLDDEPIGFRGEDVSLWSTTQCVRKNAVDFVDGLATNLSRV